MPVLSRRQISRKVRQPHDKVYRDQLRASLLDPTLTDEQRERVKRQLDSINEPKKYRADDPPPPGAIEIPGRT